MILTNNIDLVRISLNGEKIQYLPKNTNFENKKVGRIFVLGGLQNRNITDPYTNKLLISFAEFNNITITLKNKSGEIIVNNVPLYHFIFNQDSTKCIVDDYIDWENSFINILNADKIDSAEELLLYVTYDDIYTTNNVKIKNTKTITLSATIGEEYSFKKLSNFIDDYNLGKLYKIEASNYLFWGGDVWLKLYDKSGRNIDYINCNILSTFCGYWQIIDILGEGDLFKYAQWINKNNPLTFNGLDVDWERSEIVNIGDEITLTFYFI